MKKKKLSIPFLLGYALYCTVYICRYNLTIASAYFESDGIINTAQYGLMCGVFSATYSIGRLINGYIGDRADRRLMICGGIALTGVANLVIGFLPPYQAMLIFWAINGYAQSMIWGPLLTTVTSLISVSYRSLAASFFTSSVAIGSVLGILIANYTILHYGTRWAFFIPACIAGLLSIASIFTFRKNSKNQAERNIQLVNIIPRIPKIFPVISAAFFHGWIKDNVSNWAVIFFNRRFSIDIGNISCFVLLVPLIGLIGRLIYPIVYKLSKENEHLVSIIGFVCCGIAALILCYSTLVTIAAVCMCLIAAMISLVNTSMLSMYPMRFASHGNISSISGLMDFATYLGSSISAVIYGSIFSEGSNRFSWMFISWAMVSCVSIVVLIVYLKQMKKRGSMLEAGGRYICPTQNGG